MATKQSLTCSGSKPAPIPAGMSEIKARDSVATTAADIAINNVVQLLVLPANCVPTEYLLDITDLDSGSALALDFGLLTTSVNASGQRVNGTTISTAAADGGDEWIDNSTLAGGTSGIALDTASAALHRVLMAVTPVDYDRVVAVVVAVAATGALAGTIACELGYRAAR